MSSHGSKVLSFPSPVWRRSEQIGIIQRGFPARWLSLILMGSVGAAWALNPGLEQGPAPMLLPASNTVVEGDPQVVSQLLGSLIGEVALSSDDRTLLTGTVARRVVLESRVSPASTLAAQREKAEFVRAVEEVEADYTVSGRYPAVPATGGQGAVLSYRTDGDDFTLSSGNRRYTAAQGMTYGSPPPLGTEFEVKGFLSPQSGGWGPWRKDGVALEPKAGVDGLAGLEFLEDLPLVSPGTARMFFPVDQATCGYLFREHGGATVYTTGEFTYDATSGNFSLKLFRAGEAATHSLNPEALEAEVANREAPVVLAGEAALLSDLGLAAPPKEGEDVVAVSTAAPVPCTVSSALDGLRLASLEKHKEVLTPGSFAGAPDSQAKATVVGRVQFLDKLGQLHQLRLRGGRGANYDWIVGQVCPLQEEVRVAGFVDSEAASYHRPTLAGEQWVKAGR